MLSERKSFSSPPSPEGVKKIAKEVMGGAAHLAKAATGALAREAAARIKATKLGQILEKGIIDKEPELQFGDYSGVDIERLNRERVKRNVERAARKGYGTEKAENVIPLTGSSHHVGIKGDDEDLPEQNARAA